MAFIKNDSLLGISREETVAFGDNLNMEQSDPALRKLGVRLCHKALPVFEALISARVDP